MFSSFIRRPLSSTLFPYTTLFRSLGGELLIGVFGGLRFGGRIDGIAELHLQGREFLKFLAPRPSRSEEHTSELQSRFDLVCRLLLEKKKKKKIICTNIKYIYIYVS